jgi:hypothetical protein
MEKIVYRESFTIFDLLHLNYKVQDENGERENEKKTDLFQN